MFRVASIRIRLGTNVSTGRHMNGSANRGHNLRRFDNLALNTDRIYSIVKLDKDSDSFYCGIIDGDQVVCRNVMPEFHAYLSDLFHNTRKGSRFVRFGEYVIDAKKIESLTVNDDTVCMSFANGHRNTPDRYIIKKSEYPEKYNDMKQLYDSLGKHQ